MSLSYEISHRLSFLKIALHLPIYYGSSVFGSSVPDALYIVLLLLYRSVRMNCGRNKLIPKFVIIRDSSAEFHRVMLSHDAEVISSGV